MAELTAYSGLAALLVPDLPGADLDVITAYLHRAGRKFCADSEVFRQEPSRTLAFGTDRYSLILTDAQVRRIVRVRFLDPTVDEVKNYGDGREIAPDYYYLDEANQDLILRKQAEVQTHETGYTLAVEVAYVPHTGADVLPDSFLTRWADAIRYRAMFELTGMSKRPWSDPQAEQKFMVLYDDAVARARFEETHEHKKVNKTMRASPFVGTSRSWI